MMASAASQQTSTSLPIVIPEGNSADALEIVQNYWRKTKGISPIYNLLLSDQDLTLVSASKGVFNAHLRVTDAHVNSRKTIHGAVSGAIVDWAGGLAIATHGLDKTGASIDIHVTYLSTCSLGDTLEIVGVADKVGRSMAFTTVTISKLVDGKPGPIVAKGTHTKYRQ